MSRILIVTDAWYPQTNGVVRCLDNVGRELRGRGESIDYLTPDRTLERVWYDVPADGHVSEVVGAASGA